MSKFTKGPATVEASTHGALWVESDTADIADYYQQTDNDGEIYVKANAAANAELHVAAINAATRAEEMGFDGQAAIEALPELLGIISLTAGQPMLSRLLTRITKAKGE